MYVPPNPPPPSHISHKQIAGLAGVTPAAGDITHASALVLGLILGSAACSAAAAIRVKLDIDDALDVSSVHGLTGIIGSLYIGFCSSNGSCVGI